jgi:apolipoprotein N-acyltransferase
VQLFGNRFALLFSGTLAGALFSLAWPSGGFAPLLFIALVPLLAVEDAIFRKQIPYGSWTLFWSAYLAFFTFNILTTWWVRYASFFGAVAAIICNALFMALVFQMFHRIRVKTGGKIGYLALFVFWIAFEHLHMDWDLSWPWLTLGNGFAGWPRMIQWYEFTGVLGGSLWVLAVNVLIYRAAAKRIFNIGTFNLNKAVVILSVLILVPIGYSIIRYETLDETSDPVQIAVVQPNIDPYNEKFSGMSSQDQLARILQLAYTVTDSSTDIVVAPETALPDGIWEEELERHRHVSMLRRFAADHGGADWVIGLASNKLYNDSNHRTSTARRFRDTALYYDSYNTAMLPGQGGAIQLHHKSKLVPGVEKMPFPALFKHLENLAIDLGGTSGSLGMQEHPSVFTLKSGKRVAPVICYESIYGDYLSQQIRNGAELILIITNDGWWDNTPGHRQHLKYATLRAIESRRSIARSANTGISCFINQRGDILQATSWWEPAAIKATINANSDLTFYSKLGDYPGLLALIATPLLIFLGFRRKQS